MPPDKIIDKARKLMAMTVENGATEQEAYTAAMQLRKLLDKYNLSFGSLSKEAMKKKVEIKEISYPGKRKDHAFIELASTVSWGYGSELIIARNGVEFIGIGANAIVAKEMFHYLWQIFNEIAEGQGRRSGRKGPKLKSFKHSFILGASEELKYRFFLKNKEKEALAPEGGFELIRTDCLNEEIDKLYPNLGSYNHNNQKNDIHGYLEGQKAGSKISLNKQIKNEETDKEKIETILQDNDHLIEAVMNIDNIKDFLGADNPHRVLQKLVHDSGLTYYKLEKLSGIQRSYFSSIDKGEVKEFSHETIVKLAILFELDPIEFSLKFALCNTLKVLDEIDLSSIEPISKHIKYYTSLDQCEHCQNEFQSVYTGRHPEYGDVFIAECPQCLKQTKAMNSLQLTNKGPDGAIKACKETLNNNE